MTSPVLGKRELGREREKWRWQKGNKNLCEGGGVSGGFSPKGTHPKKDKKEGDEMAKLGRESNLSLARMLGFPEKEKKLFYKCRR